MRSSTKVKKRFTTAVEQLSFDFCGCGDSPSSFRPQNGRFAQVSARKATGATYTPHDLAIYVAFQLVSSAVDLLDREVIRVLDPAIGDGVLALALLQVLHRRSHARVFLTAYETDTSAAAAAHEALQSTFPSAGIEIREIDFLAHVDTTRYDFAIANPPYVRTQILGADGAGALAARFGLAGRVDLYQAFALQLIHQLTPNGALGLITSNRFFSTKGTAAFRDALRELLSIVRVWDLGDTKVFDAAVLPALLVGRKRGRGAERAEDTEFTSIYAQSTTVATPVSSVVAALEMQGHVSVGDRVFFVRQGFLHPRHGEVWRLSSASVDAWLQAVQTKTWRQLGQIGKIRVGVKTTADKVFIRDDWSVMGSDTPELLRPLITHHVADRYRGRPTTRQILYPHLDACGRRKVADLAEYPNSAAYLETHRRVLEARQYVTAAGRNWFELWVPQEPSLWSRAKLVFRDITDKPTFWLDTTGSVVNGDCYWMVDETHDNEDVLWLALAVTNSTFIEAYYDRSFNNKLYAGRRRFMSQYVEHFPLPNPSCAVGRDLIALAKRRYDCTDVALHPEQEKAIDDLVWRSFGVSSTSDITL